MDFIGDTSGLFGLIKLFFFGAAMGAVAGGFIRLSQMKEEKKKEKLKKKKD